MNWEVLNFDVILVEVILVLFAFLILGLDLFKKKSHFSFKYIIIFSQILAIILIIARFFDVEQGFYQFISVDSWSNILKLIIIGGTLFCILLGEKFLKHFKIHYGEFYFIINIVLASMMLMASTNHLFFIYLTIETVSIASFILCAIQRNNLLSLEAGMKYFILNAFASAILLYGIALIFGGTGKFNLLEIHNFLANQDTEPFMELGLILLIVGFAFKISLVPFHMWAPDVYEGAPINITAFLSTPVKIVLIAVLTKVLLYGFATYHQTWIWAISLIAGFTIIIGNLLALVQQKLKRLLAYSSISQTGYLLLGIIAFSGNGISAILFYFVVYSLASLGIFAAIIFLCGQKEETIYFEDLRGLGFVYPWVALSIVLFALSLAGIPPTAGFIGKFQLFYAALQNGYWTLVFLGLVGSIISVVYYFRFSVKLFMTSKISHNLTYLPSYDLSLTIIIASIGILGLGIYPDILKQITDSIQEQFNSFYK